ncbi:MAG: VOC family protein, partial [Deltaproteobacteria bacterium]|nr:VOC family protein [Deltaproteobacteria bacterium]
MIKTKGLYHSGIPVNDLDRAIEFYRDVLGMDVANVARDDLKGLGRADLRSGGSIVVLFQRPNPIERDALAEDGVTHQAFFVDGDDFDTAEERMR